MKNIIGVRFKKLGKIYFFNPKNLKVHKGDKVIVETARGIECGFVAMETKKINNEQITHPLKKIIRIRRSCDSK